MPKKILLSFTLPLFLITLSYSVKASTFDIQTNAQNTQHNLLQQQNSAIKGHTFKELADALHFYEAIENSGKIQNIPVGPSLRLNDTHPHISLLRHQLQLLGDLKPDTVALEDPELFDATLHKALLRFQERHGVEVDGVLGRQTRSLLNTSPAYRLQQLKVNMVRQQRFVLPPEDHYIQVNIPEFKLRLYEQDQVILDMKTIVGRSKRQTPVFDSNINTIVVNPSWNVPKSIAYKDILPKWKQDSDYLNKHNLQIRSGWGSDSAIIPSDQVDPSSLYKGADYLRLYEPPNKSNTLGQFKFISPSNYAIYLHDTSAKNLFNKTQRAFSSGCIRLEKAQELADALLKIAKRSEQGQLEKLMTTDVTRNIPLREPIPLHVVYWTAWLDEQGMLNFRNDLYNRDISDLATLETISNLKNIIQQPISQ